jgi:hypothetical protein
MRNPNETKGENVQTKTQACPVCGMEKSEWKANAGKGVEKSGQTFCCEGCANGKECTC